MARHKVVASFWEEPVGPPENYVRHRRGDVIDVPDEHVARLLRLNAIEPVDIESHIDAEDVALTDWLAAEAKWQSEVASQQPVTPADLAGDSDVQASDELPERPKQAASAKAWEDYAVRLFELTAGERGFTREDAEKATKQDLISLLP